jgi:transmembrane sensor
MDVNERRERMSAEAAEWWLQLQSGNLSRPGRAQFVDWLRESHLHVAEMLRVAQVHDALGQFEHWARIATEGATGADDIVTTIREAPAREVASLAKRSRPLWLAAASVAAAMVAGVGIFNTWSGDSIVTDTAERRELALADGTVVQVDPQTRLRLNYTRDSRLVVLDRGRALFRVARDPARSFIVQADGTTVRAIGTAFGVEQEENGVIITVSEGKVAVQSAASRPASRVELTANQQLVVSRFDRAASARKVDSTRALAWAEGRLVFENDSVGDVVERFNSYNRIQLRVKDDTLAQRTVSGVFDASDPESFVAFIQTVAELRVVRSGDRHITLAPPR